jgi:TolB protein
MIHLQRLCLFSRGGGKPTGTVGRQTLHLTGSPARLAPFSLLALCIAAAMLLSACAPSSQVSVDQPAATGSMRGEALPGRLLFVADGAIWQWQGREARPLITAGNPTQPTFDPLGERIAYVSRSNSATDLLIADRTGRELARLTTNDSAAPPNSLERAYAGRWALYPAWSPDGVELVAASQAAPPAGEPPAEYNLALFSLTPGAASPLTPLYADNAAHCGRSAFAPDGSLVFVRAATARDGVQQLYWLDPLLGTVAPVPGAPAPSYDPAFSPDGAWLAFAARTATGTAIHVLPAGGGAAQQLIQLSSARTPAFSPDGKLLAFLAIAPGGSGFDLWVSDLRVSADGTLSAGEPRQVTTNRYLDADAGLSWGP